MEAWKGRAAGGGKRWDLGLQERRGQCEGAQVEEERYTRRASGYPGTRKVVLLRHMTPPNVLSPPHQLPTHRATSLSIPPRSLQVLWTMPASFCRLTMPVSLLMTSESSKDGGLGAVIRWGSQWDLVQL